MAQVNLTVNGRVYRIACGDGEEEHLARLGERFEEAINELRSELGEIGDQRLMVMAGILMTDRLDHAERSLLRSEQEVAVLKDRRADSSMRLEGLDRSFAETLNLAAERIEQITERLRDVVDRPDRAGG